MNYQEDYQKKRTTPAKAVEIVKSGDWLDFGWCNNIPVALDKALAARTDELFDVNVRGAVLTSVPTIFQREDAGEHFTWNSWHMGGLERKMIDRGLAFYIPLRYSELPKYYRELDTKPNVVMIVCTPMDKDGYFNFGPNTSHMAAACDVADKVIVEINEKMPFCLGGPESRIHISQVDMIVEGENNPIPTIGSTEATDVDLAVAKLIVERIPNGACLQLGIGGMPNTVGSLIAKSDLKDLGVHTEMYVDAFVDLAEAGKITGAQKNIDRYKQTFAFALGSQKMYDYMDNNPELMSAPVNYVNDARTISQLDNFMSINNCVDVDLFGQVNAESSGLKHISGAGGQLDFVLGAYLSKGGKSFICCSSTFTDRNGNLQSRIRPTLSNGSIVTDTRTNVHYLVTEFGIVNLKGLSTWQRSEAIISLAHPQFREELIQEAAKMKIWRNSNKR